MIACVPLLSVPRVLPIISPSLMAQVSDTKLSDIDAILQEMKPKLRGGSFILSASEWPCNHPLAVAITRISDKITGNTMTHRSLHMSKNAQRHCPVRWERVSSSSTGRPKRDHLLKDQFSEGPHKNRIILLWIFGPRLRIVKWSKEYVVGGTVPQHIYTSTQTLYKHIYMKWIT